MSVNLSNAAFAFLRDGDKYLLMKRAADRRVSPDVWHGVGGRMEPDELNDPRAACLREVWEESGITAEQIRDLTLRYIIIRRYRDTIRQTYVYFGETNAEAVDKTDEGKLSWIPESELLNRTYTVTFAAMLEHYRTMPDSGRVIVGVAVNNGGKCRMVWSAIEDFEPLS
jgi:8-oxo-dGTP diphosphatase